MIVDHESFSHAMNRIEKSPTLAVDLETTGFVPWSTPHQNSICGIAVFDGYDSWYFPVSHSNSENITSEQLKQLVNVISTRKRLINHNIKFDLNFLAVLGLDFKGTVVDTMNGLYLRDETKTKKLKEACDTLIEDGSSKEQKDLETQLEIWNYKKDEIWRLPAIQVAPYAEQDTRLAWRLAIELSKRFDNVMNGLWLEMNALTLISHKMEVHGMPLNLSKLVELEREARSNCSRLFLQCHKLAPRLNIKSPKEVAKHFKIPSADYDHLKKVNDELAKKILEFREWDKGISTYYEPFHSDFLAKDHRIHATFKTTGTRSGRWSSSAPNLQNIPRKSDTQRVKEVFEAPEGHSFVEIDYSQAEIRLAAHYTQDESLCAAIRKGLDIHSFVAEEAKIDRQTAKTINFATIYGAGAAVLAEQLNIEESQARKFLDQYDKRFPGYKKTSRKCTELAETRGKIRMWNGRFRHFDKAAGEIPRTAFNQLIQGGVAQMMNRTMVSVADGVPDATMISQIHDATYFLIPDEKVVDYVPEIVSIMEHQPQFIVPMTVDVKVGKNLGNGMKKYDIR